MEAMDWGRDLVRVLGERRVWRSGGRRRGGRPEPTAPTSPTAWSSTPVSSNDVWNHSPFLFLNPSFSLILMLGYTKVAEGKSRLRILIAAQVSQAVLNLLFFFSFSSKSIIIDWKSWFFFCLACDWTLIWIFMNWALFYVARYLRIQIPQNPVWKCTTKKHFFPCWFLGGCLFSSEICLNFFELQGVSLVLASLLVFLAASQERSFDNFAIITISIGFISLLIGEIGLF